MNHEHHLLHPIQPPMEDTETVSSIQEVLPPETNLAENIPEEELLADREVANNQLPVETSETLRVKIASETADYNAVREKLGMEKVEKPTTASIEALKEQEKNLPLTEIKKEEMEGVSRHLDRIVNSFGELRVAVRQDKDGHLGENFAGKVGSSIDRIDTILSQKDKYGFKTVEAIEGVITESLNKLGEGKRPIPSKDTLKLFSRTRDALSEIRVENKKLQIFAKEGQTQELQEQYLAVQKTNMKLDKALDFLDQLHNAAAKYLR